MSQARDIGAVAILAISVLPSLGVRAQPEQPLPKIREFDTATIERLGREIYEQDQLAWKATDVVLGQRGGERGLRRDGMKGWITETADGSSVVRMIRVGRSGPEALYDVTFVSGMPPVLSTPENKTLNAAERAQYDARMLALENIGKLRCSDRYNTVALKDTESDGWLVWALASSSDEDAIVTRGHYRFTISADGKTIVEKDALSTTCLQFSKNAMRREAESKNATPVAALSINHIVSSRPVETYVFTSLSYPYTLYVGTKDGQAWKFDKGSVSTIADDAPDPDGISARSFEAMAEQCVGVATDPSKTPQRYYPTKNLFKVIQTTEHNQPFVAKLDGGFEMVGVICSRLSIVPSTNDYKVAVRNTKLSITDIGEGHPKRTGELVRVDGKFTFQIKEGEPLSDDLAARVAARLEAFQRAIQTSN